jgi:hypothetical protein
MSALMPPRLSRTAHEEVLGAARFFAGLPSFLRRQLTIEEARAALRLRFEQRERDFLDLVRAEVYANPASPYRALLGLAGCEYGDLEHLVRDEGLEGALRLLYRRGVYLTIDEFKGRRPAVRGSASVAVEPARLRRGQGGGRVPLGSGGSRGVPTRVMYSLPHIRERAVNILLILDALGGVGWRHAAWGVPGSGTIVHLLDYAALGARPVRWFSQVDPAAPALDRAYRWSGRALRLSSLLAGAPLPAPRYVPPDDPLPIVRWMAAVVRGGGVPHLKTFVNSAVRVCQRAVEAGLEIGGARFTVGGEPVTEARLAAVGQAGAALIQRYAAIEASHLAYGCLAPRGPDDQHVLDDFNALIAAEPDGGAVLPAGTLLVSSLRSTAPFTLLNVSLGDRAALSRRACGCPLERLGWAQHLEAIVSDEKLTAGGMTFFDTDVIRVLEETLPARFGGGPTDYQLLEAPGASGEPGLRLLVHPRLGPLDEAALREAFLTGIGPGQGAERVMALQWRAAGLPQVERRPPLATSAGKILHLHQG